MKNVDEVQRFLAYVRSFDPDVPRIRLKQEHSLRVSALCAQLARRKGWCETEIALARQIGLLHDIGRFRQVVQYGTFVDGASVSHAALGAKILFEELFECFFGRTLLHLSQLSIGVVYIVCREDWRAPGPPDRLVPA